MKSKLSRILSVILILTLLLSTFAVFALAETNDETTEDTEEEENKFNLLYHRTYDEGWDIKNGLYFVDRGSFFTIEHETTPDYDINYFWRLEVGSSENSYMQADYDAVDNIGSVMEFDIKSDDITSIKNVVTFGTTGGTSAARNNYNLMNIVDNQVFIMQSGDYTEYTGYGSTTPAFELTNDWTRVQVIFDYTYEYNPILETDTPAEIEKKTLENKNWFQAYIYYGPADGSQPMTLFAGQPLVLYGKGGRAAQLFRFNTSGEPEENYGASVCFDNIKMYTGTNQITEITPEMGHGTEVDPFYPITEEIIGAGSTNDALNAYNNSLAFKVGVNYCYMKQEKQNIATAADGSAYGAPVVVNGNVMVPLDKVLDYINYPYYIHPDGEYIDITTGTSAAYLVIGKDVATVGSERVTLTAAPAYVTDAKGNTFIAIALKDVDTIFPGYFADYDETGFIMITTIPDIIDRRVNLISMANTMKEFIYDEPTAEEVYNDIKDYTNFEHPYIYTNADRLEEMYQEYQYLNDKMERGEILEDWNNEEYVLWVHYQRRVNYGEDGYKQYALKDANGQYAEFVGLESDESKRRSTSYSLAQPYMKETDKGASGYADGYDIGGRSNAVNRTEILERMAIAYTLTRDIKYLQCAYEVAVILGEWTHWGPGHFLNCADASYHYAVYFDWTYNAYNELREQGITRADGSEYSVEVLGEILFRQGVHEGFVVCGGYGDKSEATIVKYGHESQVVDFGGSLYTHRDNNWNAVCTSGMVMASLAVMGESGGAFVNEASFVIEQSLEGLTTNGLDMYLPDGAYIEGPGYWNYGTNSFFRLCIALQSSVGSTYGLMDCYGIDQTCYFACHTESSDCRTFNFHDGAMSSQDTSMFFYVASVFNDATLYDVRLNQINSNSKWAEIIDLIFYPKEGIDSSEVQLDYYTDQIDLFATRSGWEKGSLYAAIIGGTNELGHGQIDAGSFVYHNLGKVWLIDLGTEEYNCEGFWPAATRYRFYVMKPEGNNTLALSSDPAQTPYGQLLSGIADAKEWGNNEHGAYVVYDMTDTMRIRASKWERGMMLTNDRQTTIIQDQLTFNSMQTVYWFAHYSFSYVQDVQISKDGRTAYLYSYSGKDDRGRELYDVLRLSIVSAKTNYKFEIMDTYTFVHNSADFIAKGVVDKSTYVKGYIATQGKGVPERDRSNYNKLAICSEPTLDFNLAVVIEVVDIDTVGKNNEKDLGYNWTDMNEWVPTEDMRGQEIIDESIPKRGIANVNTHIAQSMAKADILYGDESAFGGRIEEFYRAITDAYYAVRVIGIDMPAGYESQLASLKEYRESFKAYREEVLRLQESQTNLIYKLMGVSN